MMPSHSKRHQSVADNVGRYSRQPQLFLALLVFAFLLAACEPEQGILGALPGRASSPQFEDVAQETGLAFQNGAFHWGLSGDPPAMMGGGLCWLDYNRDGWQDLFVTNTYALEEAGQWEAQGGLPTSALFRNNQGRFSDVTEASAAGLPMRGSGCVAADLDRDGWTDLYVTTERSNILLWNNGDGTFTEGAQEAGVDTYGWQAGASVGDLNADGWPDLFVAGYVDMNSRIPDATLGFPNSHQPRFDSLYLNEGNADSNGRPSFRDVTEVVGLKSDQAEYGLGSLLSDFDADGDLDLYVANDTNPNRLYENIPWPGGSAADPEGIGFRFQERAAQAGVADRNSGMGVASGDMDGDGRFDLIVTNMGQQLHAAFLNQSKPGKLRFEDALPAMQLPDFGVGWTGWGTMWGDLDLDSDQDLIVVNGAIPVSDLEADAQIQHIYANETAQGQPGVFTDATEVMNLDEVGPILGRGGALADYDNDGDLDIAISSIAGPLVLLQNSGVEGNWLELMIDGPGPGTVVTATLPDGRRLRREVGAGSSYLSTNDTRVHLGLGGANRIETLRIRWPDGSSVHINNVPANQQLIIGP